MCTQRFLGKLLAIGDAIFPLRIVEPDGPQRFGVVDGHELRFQAAAINATANQVFRKHDAVVSDHSHSIQQFRS